MPPKYPNPQSPTTWLPQPPARKPPGHQSSYTGKCPALSQLLRSTTPDLEPARIPQPNRTESLPVQLQPTPHKPLFAMSRLVFLTQNFLKRPANMFLSQPDMFFCRSRLFQKKSDLFFFPAFLQSCPTCFPFRKKLCFSSASNLFMK